MANPESGDRTCFFISPIGDEGSESRKRSDTVKKFILERALVPVFVTAVKRADEDSNPGEITPSIITAILDADLIVADLTDANANVFYEVAVAHAYDKPTIHIRFTGERIPFDLKDVRVFEYGLDLVGGERAREAIESAAKSLLVDKVAARTPVSGGRTLHEVQRSPDLEDRVSAELLARMGRLEIAIDRIARGDAIRPNNPLAVAEARLRSKLSINGRLQLQLSAIKEGIAEAERQDRTDLAQDLTQSQLELESEIRAIDEAIVKDEERLRSLHMSHERHPSRSGATLRELRPLDPKMSEDVDD